MLFLEKSSRITIDFKTHKLKADALLFINMNQWYQLVTEDNAASGALIYYTRNFYCVQIHDREVSCDGILYNNVYEIPVVHLSNEQSKEVKSIINQIVQEIKNDDHPVEVHSTIIWRSFYFMHSGIETFTPKLLIINKF
jgi:hypothetical protein